MYIDQQAFEASIFICLRSFFDLGVTLASDWLECATWMHLFKSYCRADEQFTFILLYLWYNLCKLFTSHLVVQSSWKGVFMACESTFLVGFFECNVTWECNLEWWNEHSDNIQMVIKLVGSEYYILKSNAAEEAIDVVWIQGINW